MRQVLHVALLVILGLAVHLHAKCPEDPTKSVALGKTWSCTCFEEKSKERLDCKDNRSQNRAKWCPWKTGISKRWWCARRKKQCKGGDANKDYCDISSNADGENDFVPLSCMGSGRKGQCPLYLVTSYDELEDTEKEIYTDEQDYNEIYRDDATLEICRDYDCIENYCRLRCLASSDCHGFEFETTSTGGFYGKCRLILNPISQTEGYTANTFEPPTRCFVRDQDCTSKIPSSCTEEVSSGNGCWGAGPGYKPCKDLACSEDECKLLCQVNTKCQGFEIGPDDLDEGAGFPTCIHYDLLPKAANPAVPGSCFRVARSHQFNDVGCSSETLDPLPEGLNIREWLELDDQPEWDTEGDT